MLKTTNLFKQTNKEMQQLNDEYEKKSAMNKINSTAIRKSIQQKSDDFKHTKGQRSRHFDVIRKK